MDNIWGGGSLTDPAEIKTRSTSIAYKLEAHNSSLFKRSGLELKHFLSQDLS